MDQIVDQVVRLVFDVAVVVLVPLDSAAEKPRPH